MLIVKVFEKFQFLPSKIVVNSDGTEVDESDVLLSLSGEVLLALRDGEEWQVYNSVTVASPEKLQSCIQSLSSSPLLPLQEGESSSTEQMLNTSELKSFPTVYCLPMLPKHLTAALEKASSKADLDVSSERQLIRVVYDDLLQYSLYPTSLMYQAVCQAIVRTYPKLQDKIVFLRQKASKPYATWLDSLKTRFKSERSKMHNVSSVQEHKKFGTTLKRKGLYIECAVTPKQKRSEMQTNAMEDLLSCIAHKETISNELKKSLPDMSKVRDRMAKTFVHRRRIILNSSTTQILEEYPALKIATELLEEANLITGNEGTSKINQFFTAERSLKILEMAKSGKRNAKNNDFVTNIVAAIGSESNFNIEAQQIRASMLCLPAMFGEQIERWLVINKESTLSTPTIRIICSNQANILHFEDVHRAIYLDGLVICNVQSIDEALKVLIASYWVFEIAFDPRLQKTLTFLANYICGLSEFRVSPPVQRLLNK
ncbi:uncharacterized protein LOC136092275 isoform X2 [Hydra vulgaris]